MDAAEKAEEVFFEEIRNVLINSPFFMTRMGLLNRRERKRLAERLAKMLATAPEHYAQEELAKQRQGLPNRRDRRKMLRAT
jgi:hypothetical protein